MSRPAALALPRRNERRFAMPKLGTLTGTLVAGERQHWRNLTVVMLHRSEPITPPVDYVLAARAMERGFLRVTEVSDGGQVQILRAENRGPLPVLLLDGEELRGAKQNRIVNCDVLLRAHGAAELPVACVEQGRWRYQRPDFVVGGYSPARLRARQSRAVKVHLQACGRPRADQGEVWEDVDELLRAVCAESATAAMADAVEPMRPMLDALGEAVAWQADAVGVVVYIEKRLAGMDVFDRPGTLQQVWDRLLGGYAMDAVAGRVPPKDMGGPEGTDNLLTRVGQCRCEVFSGVDMGEDWRLQDVDFTGSALVIEEQALHLSVFPALPGEGDTRPAAVRRIAGPSWRSHRRG
ncbi:MAG: hypothetical protein D6725_03140 [Planctomycetota bacterium]|nr:MAG: hypothetical protein D6725_03140 [Planctomycetota bacterium]